MRRACSLFFVFLSWQVCAQQQIDSLAQSLNPEKITVLNRQLWRAVDHGMLRKIETDRAKWDPLINAIAEKLVARSKSFNTDAQAIVLSHMAEVIVREKTSGPGYSYIQEAVNLVGKKNNDAAAYAYYKYAQIFYNLNRMDSAVFYAEKTLNMALASGSDSIIKESLQQIGNFCYKSKNFAKAELYFKKLIANPLTVPGDSKSHLNTIGLTFRGRQLYDSARLYFRKSLDIAIQLHDTTWIGLVEGNIGHTYFLQKNFEKALPGLLIDAKYSVKKRNKMSAVSAFNSLLEIYMAENKLDIAKKYYDTLSRYARGEKNEDVRIEYYQSAADFYQKIGKSDSAMKFLKLYLDLNNSLTQEEYNLNAAQLSAQFEFDRQIGQIKELEKFNKAQSKENQLKSYFLFATTSLILLGGIFIYVQYKTNRFKNRTNLILQTQNERIAEQANHLNELNATKDKLFAIIGHDLRSPINSLKGLMSMVKNQMISRDEFETFLVKLQNSVDQVHLTLNNLLHWSGTQLNGLSIKPEQVDVKKLAGETLDLLQEQAASKNIKLINELDSKTKVLADPDHIRLVLRNLISNAIKFTNPDGIVKLTAIPEKEKVILCVEDSGIGMSKQACEHIFGVTTTFSTSGTGGEKGTGLGLLLCKEVIERNGGKIWAESTLGEGSKMKFSLPLVS